MPADRSAPGELDSLYRDHYGWLHRRLCGKLDCEAQAADLAQDTFVRVLADAAHARLPSLRQPRAFLATISRRLLANHWRRQRIEQLYLAELSARPEPVEISTETRAILIETLVEVDRALASLPPRVRQAFLMTQLDGASHAEVAQALGLSLATVKRYLVRAGMRCYFAL